MNGVKKLACGVVLSAALGAASAWATTIDLVDCCAALYLDVATSVHDYRPRNTVTAGGGGGEDVEHGGFHPPQPEQDRGADGVQPAPAWRTRLLR